MVETIAIGPSGEGEAFIASTTFADCTVEGTETEVDPDDSYYGDGEVSAFVRCEVSGDTSEFREKVRSNQKVELLN